MSNLAFVDFIFGTRRTGYAWGVFQDRWGGKEIAAGCARSKREARNNIKQAIRKAKTRYENRKMSDRLVQVMMHGPEKAISWPAVGLAIIHAPHFLVTDFYVRRSRISNLREIGANPALTHIGTGKWVSQRLKSIDQASKIAVVLEALPICWDGTVEEIYANFAAMPQVLQRWLQVEVCGMQHLERQSGSE